MAAIQLEAVEKWFGETHVIRGVDLEIADGEFVVFVGPSGCGKSTLLRMIAGLEDVSDGSIRLDGKDVTDQMPSERGLSMVFQSYALYPHMTVRENMAFGLKTARVARSEIATRVEAAADTLKLGPLLDRKPKALSGGQRQRVAIGRAIVREPSGFLFDEPLSNLDAALRVEMRLEIARLHDQLGATMIYVTHDQVEAMTLADRIVVLDAGRIMQTGSPRELYERPGNRFVAEFIGSPKMNLIDGASSDSSRPVTAHTSLSLSGYDVPAEATSVGIRPEHISLNGGVGSAVSGVVDVVEYLGADIFLNVDCDDCGMISVRTDGQTAVSRGDQVELGFPASRLHFFSQNGQRVG